MRDRQRIFDEIGAERPPTARIEITQAGTCAAARIKGAQMLAVAKTGEGNKGAVLPGYLVLRLTDLVLKLGFVVRHSHRRAGAFA